MRNSLHKTVAVSDLVSRYGIENENEVDSDGGKNAQWALNSLIKQSEADGLLFFSYKPTIVILHLFQL